MIICLGSLCKLYTFDELNNLDLVNNNSKLTYNEIEKEINKLTDFEIKVKKAVTGVLTINKHSERTGLHKYIVKFFTRGLG